MSGATTEDIERKSIVIDYFRRLDEGDDFIHLFAEDARVFYPKWGTATGHDEIGEMFGDVGSTVNQMSHDYEYFNYVTDGDVVVVEGTSTGETADGIEWRSNGEPGGGRWCDVFEVRNGKIRRLFIYLDPDCAGTDTDQYPWLCVEPGATLRATGINNHNGCRRLVDANSVHSASAVLRAFSSVVAKSDRYDSSGNTPLQRCTLLA